MYLCVLSHTHIYTQMSVHADIFSWELIFEHVSQNPLVYFQCDNLYLEQGQASVL